jgi:hypothetical protein
VCATGNATCAIENAASSTAETTKGYADGA